MRMETMKSRDALRLPAARSPLAPGPRGRWRVASAHPHAVHLLAEEAEAPEECAGATVLSLGDAAALDLPTQWRLGAHGPWWHALEPGDPVLGDTDSLTWTGRDGRDRVVAAVRPWHPARVHATATGAPLPAADHARLAEAASDLVADPALAAFAARPRPDAAIALLGRGPGLTPAGDDAICGVLLAARALGRPAAATDALVALARRRTTALSAACIDAARRGYGVAQVVRLIGDVASGRLAEQTLHDVVTIGHSSGRDLLAGVWSQLPNPRKAAP